MKEFFKKPDVGLLIMRVGLGLFMMNHGLSTFMGGSRAIESVGKGLSVFGIAIFPLFFGAIAALIEFLGGFLFTIGFKFRIASALLFIVMVVATSFMYDSHISAGFAVVNKIAWPAELALVFLGLLFIGPGKYSADKG